MNSLVLKSLKVNQINSKVSLINSNQINPDPEVGSLYDIFNIWKSSSHCSCFLVSFFNLVIYIMIT